MPTSAVSPQSSEASLLQVSRSTLIDSIARAAQFLPAQGPIETFVHHNTLHCLEGHSFHEAIEIGQKLYQAEGYLTETQYRDHLKSGRISSATLLELIDTQLGKTCQDKVAGLGSRRQIQIDLLNQVIHSNRPNEIRWLAAEHKIFDQFASSVSASIKEKMVTSARVWLKSQADDSHRKQFKEFFRSHGASPDSWSADVWESFSLRLVWQIFRENVDTSIVAEQRVVRLRDRLWRITGDDCDRRVHEVLIRFTAAFVDQGYSNWNLPNRDESFFDAFLTVYRRPVKGLQRWLRGLPADLENRVAAGMDCWDSIAHSLQEFQVAEADVDEVILQALLSLRGWAGMLHQLQTGRETNVHPIPDDSLAGFLAVALILEKQALLSFGVDLLGQHVELGDVLQHLSNSKAEFYQPERPNVAFPLFQLAQHQGWTPQRLLDLNPDQWSELCDEIRSFDELKRRQVLHDAYERHYLEAALDAFAAHAKVRCSVVPPWMESTETQCPSFQFLTCIDDREESFRRHLEEVQPTCETFGAAGFFAVAMYYRGAADSFYQPLCPGVIVPDHYVQEDIGYTFEGVHQGRAQLRKRLGLATHVFHTRSRTFVGGIVAGILGSLATAPLVA